MYAVRVSTEPFVLFLLQTWERNVFAWPSVLGCCCSLPVQNLEQGYLEQAVQFWNSSEGERSIKDSQKRLFCWGRMSQTEELCISFFKLILRKIYYMILNKSDLPDHISFKNYLYERIWVNVLKIIVNILSIASSHKLIWDYGAAF